MDQDRNYGKKSSVFKRKKSFLTSQRRRDARFLEIMQEHPEIVPESDRIEAPPGEFQKIMAEMDERGIKPAVRGQLKLKACFDRAGKLIRKPAFIALLVFLILGGTSAGVSAKKAYDYRMREREVGRSDIVWNNDEYVLMGDDGIDSVYTDIEDQLNIKPLKLMFIPFDMKFEELKIYGDHANIKFSYDDKAFNCIQSKKPVASSDNVVSDRSKYKQIYNEWLGVTIPVEKNNLNNDEVEYSAKFDLNGGYFYISGIIDEANFEEILKNLTY